MTVHHHLYEDDIIVLVIKDCEQHIKNVPVQHDDILYLSFFKAETRQHPCTDFTQLGLIIIITLTIIIFIIIIIPPG